MSSPEITVTLPSGYAGTFHQVEGPSNPIEEGFGHPPCLTRYWDRSGWSKWEDNGRGLDWQDIYNLIPDEKFSDANISDTLKKLDPGDVLPPLTEIRQEALEWNDSVRHVLSEKIQEEGLADCSNFRPEGKGIEFLETVASLAGIPYLAKRDSGYCQGDHSEVFAFCSPGWVVDVGCPPENFEASMKEAARQYFAWCWGNVWFLAELVRPDGTEGDRDEFAWDIYGTPDEKGSYGMETLQEAAETDAAEVAREAAETAARASKEAAEAEFWAARDSLTV